MLAQSNCDILFAPDADEMYPGGKYKTIDYNPGSISLRLEGASRPGHFAGVLAVVKRLFDIIQPDRAYFGQKDYQQFLIVSEMAAHYQLPVELILCPIFREENGLAMSSRNERLSPGLRMEARLIHEILEKTALRLEAGEQDIAALVRDAKEELSRNRNFTVDYFDICSAKTLEPLSEIKAGTVLICTAVIVEGIRLIDNRIAGENHDY
jgi:pantoate--beta-alanine ligase